MEGAGDLERLIDLPRSIVWDALLDPVLVEGWLHPTARLLEGDVRERVDPAPGNTAALDTVLQPFGRVRFELEERDGGTRGTSTLLRVSAPVPAGTVTWSEHIDLLENLLRGHPVDWSEPAERDQRAR